MTASACCKSYRFGSDSGIGQLAAAVNRGDRHATRTVFDGTFTDIEKKSLQSGEEYQAMLEEASVDTSIF